MSPRTLFRLTTPALLTAAFAMPVTALADDDDDRMVEKLPDKVYDALMDRFPGADILQARVDDDNDLLGDDGKDHKEYEVWLKHDGKLYEVEIENDKIDDVDREDDDRAVKDLYDDEQHKKD